MSPILKRLLLIIGLLSITTLIGLGIYYLFFKKAAPTIIPIGEVTTTSTVGKLTGAGVRQTGEGEISAGAGGLTTSDALATSQSGYYTPTVGATKITSDYATYSSVNSNNGSARYYNGGNGKFYRTKADGTIEEMVDQVFYNVSNVVWADNSDKVVLEYPDGSNVVYDFDTKKQLTSLPKHWTDFSFSPDSQQIAAKSIGTSEENRWLVTTNDNGTGTKLIEALGNNADQVTVDWSPSRQTVAFSTTGEPLGTYRRQVLFIGLNGENFKAATVEGMDFKPLWSTTGQKLLYSVYSANSDLKPELWITNAYGDQIGTNRQNLSINTWADKCAFSNDNTIYCAVPRDLPRGAGISPAVAADSYYDLYKIDLSTGLKTSVDLGGDYRIKNVSYSNTDNKIYFTDSVQSGIFEVKQ